MSAPSPAASVDHEHTFHDIVRWFDSIRKRLGLIVICDEDAKINCYKMDIASLTAAIDVRMEKALDTPAKLDDLRIMKNNLVRLAKCVRQTSAGGESMLGGARKHKRSASKSASKSRKTKSRSKKSKGSKKSKSRK